MLKFRNVEGGKPVWRKTLEARERTNKQLYSHVTSNSGIEPAWGTVV
jgi:hypothetical protein